MSRPRDSQRSKVYAAEHASGIHKEGNTPLTIRECQALVDKMLDSAYVQRKYDPEGRAHWIGRYHYRYSQGIRVDLGKNGGRAFKHGAQRVIRLGLWGRQQSVIIHEVAHHLADYRAKGDARHNWEFCDVYLDLVRHFMGKDAHDKLKQAFKDHRVKFRKPRQKRQLTPEQRQILVERAAKARAARKANIERAEAEASRQ